MPTRKPISIPWIGVVVLAVVATAYVGAYYVMVRVFTTSDGSATAPTYRYPKWVSEWRPSYRFDEAFRPMHWIDRRIRRRVWEPPNPLRH